MGGHRTRQLAECIQYARLQTLYHFFYHPALNYPTCFTSKHAARGSVPPILAGPGSNLDKIITWGRKPIVHAWTVSHSDCPVPVGCLTKPITSRISASVPVNNRERNVRLEWKLTENISVRTWNIRLRCQLDPSSISAVRDAFNHRVVPIGSTCQVIAPSHT
ncbi:hypothetical protein B0H34DRAFT_134398 [Crassisporium funariophilum]|nr:hypothetical protein B0H34DRAFT_134398 [Crassisporium funariophilum]